MFVGLHSTDQVFRDTFVKFNFASPHKKQHSSCDDLLLLNSKKTTTTGIEHNNNNNNNNISDNEILENKKRLRKFRRKQDRKRSSHEDVEVRVVGTEKDENNNNNTENARLMSKDPAMSPVNLIGFKTNSHHYQEPHYEAIKDLSLKATFRISGSNSNSSTPEGSPKLHHHRKYILNSDALLAEKISPMLERKKKLSSGKKKNPPLPKRNRSSSQFYVESAANNAVVNANPIYGNTALIMNISPRSSGSSDLKNRATRMLHFRKTSRTQLRPQQQQQRYKRNSNHKLIIHIPKSLRDQDDRNECQTLITIIMIRHRLHPRFTRFHHPSAAIGVSLITIRNHRM